MGEIEIHGRCDEKFAPVMDVLAASFARGHELGAAFALSVEGEMVVDIWAGLADGKTGAPWERDTLVPVMSCSKTMCALCGLLLLDRGLIELDEPVATYWPEFAQGGKEKLPVRYIFIHASGVAGWDVDFDTDYLCNWDEAIAQLASQEPWWEPGTQSGYHMHSYGFLLGELLRRTTGMTIREFFRDEVGDRLDADFFFGVSEDMIPRIAKPWFHTESFTGGTDNEFTRRAMGQTSGDLLTKLTDPKWLTAMLPAGNGIANARGLARAGSILANGGTVNGHEFMRPEVARLAYEEQIYTQDLMLEDRVRFGLGFAISSKEWEMPWPSVFHWGGYGGSQLAMCPDNRLSWAYTPNLFFDGAPSIDRSMPLTEAMAACFKSV